MVSEDSSLIDVDGLMSDTRSTDDGDEGLRIIFETGAMTKGCFAHGVVVDSIALFRSYYYRVFSDGNYAIVIMTQSFMFCILFLPALLLPLSTPYSPAEGSVPESGKERDRILFLRGREFGKALLKINKDCKKWSPYLSQISRTHCCIKINFGYLFGQTCHALRAHEIFWFDQHIMLKVCLLFFLHPIH